MIIIKIIIIIIILIIIILHLEQVRSSYLTRD